MKTSDLSKRGSKAHSDPELEIFKGFWKVQIKRWRKVHIIGQDEGGGPLLRTLCEKLYNSEERKGAKKGCDLEGNECSSCVAVLRKWLDEEIAEHGKTSN